MITDRDAEFIATIRFYYDRELGRLPEPEGLAGWLAQCRNGLTGEQMQQAIHDSPEAVAYRNRSLVPHLEVRGKDFVDATGTRTVFRGTDAFCAYREYRNGVDLTPFFQESKDLNFNLWRVFFMGSIAQNQVLQLSPAEPGYYDGVRPFADLCNAKGIVLLATVFVDAQDIMPDVMDQAAHWSRMTGLLRGSVTILSGGNEWRKNGFNPGDLNDPGMVWSRGSDLGDEAPYRPYGTVAEFHPRRDLPASLMDTVASPVFIYSTNGLTGPLIIDEPPRFGTNGSGPEYAAPALARRFAQHYSAECGAAVFHNYFGQHGLLMDAGTRACAVEWQKGMAI